MDIVDQTLTVHSHLNPIRFPRRMPYATLYGADVRIDTWNSEVFSVVFLTAAITFKGNPL